MKPTACPTWRDELATLRRLYPHIGKGDINARKIAHRYWCSCGSSWRRSEHLARDPERKPSE